MILIAAITDRYGRLLQTLGHKAWFSRVGRAVVPLDRALQRRTRGRVSIIGPQHFPELLLTTTGRQSGQLRTVPLLYARDGDDFVVVASNWGQAHHPAWSANLLAHPAAKVEVSGTHSMVTAVLVEGSEREQLWRLLCELWPAYQTYAGRAGRSLRVFRLSATRR